MHSLLIRIPEGVQPMLAHLESYIVQTGVDDMKACADVIFTDSEKYMEELLKLFNRFSTLVKEAFRDDSRFLTTRDKVSVCIYHLTSRVTPPPVSTSCLQSGIYNHVCTSRAHYLYQCCLDFYRLSKQSSMILLSSGWKFQPLKTSNLHSCILLVVLLCPVLASSAAMFVLRVSGPRTHAESKCPELLANYCDLLLRKSPYSKKLTSEEVESRLKQVVSETLSLLTFQLHLHTYIAP